MRRISRAQRVFTWLVGIPVVHGAVPVMLSFRGRRHGWREGRPGRWNLVGLIPLSAGAGLVAWSCAAHYQAGEGGFAVRATPEYLLRRGPYAHTRNPIYLAEALMWLGWSLLLGSSSVLGGMGVGCAALTLIVPREERGLERAFGDDYRAYRAGVPRWLPHTR